MVSLPALGRQMMKGVGMNKLNRGLGVLNLRVVCGSIRKSYSRGEIRARSENHELIQLSFDCHAVIPLH